MEKGSWPSQLRPGDVSWGRGQTLPELVVASTGAGSRGPHGETLLRTVTIEGLLLRFWQPSSSRASKTLFLQ